jgi:hypothetical protein
MKRTPVSVGFGRVTRAGTLTMEMVVATLDGTWLERFNATWGDERRAMLEAAELAQRWDVIREAAGEDDALEWLTGRVQDPSDGSAVLLTEVRSEVQALVFRLKPRVAGLRRSAEADRLREIVAVLERALAG